MKLTDINNLITVARLHIIDTANATAKVIYTDSNPISIAKLFGDRLITCIIPLDPSTVEVIVK